MNKEDKIMNIKHKSSLYHFTSLKILSFLSLHPGETFSAKEISKWTSSSKGATNQTLRLLLKMDILTRNKKGNLFLYRTNFYSTILKQFKVFENLMTILELIKNIQPYCYKIVLFGSCATGTNDVKSDIDIFINTNKAEYVQKVIAKFNRNKPYINAAIFSPLEIIEAQKKDKVFFEQIKKGITLWEGISTNEEI